MIKSYTQCMKEISPDRLYHGLLAHGLFAERLPPIFTSVNFFDYCQSRTQNFKSSGSTYIRFDSIQYTNIPRQLGIPNPMAYQQLCKCLRDNWHKICTHFEKYTSNQSHKVSEIHIRKLASKLALFEMNYKNWKIDGSPEPDLIFGKRYLVKADIATFFPSIYTHSLPWALAGKSEAKINRKKSEWYNAIDQHVQNTKHGETHGLIIGPHTSNLLSEIILTVVDYKLIQKGWKNYVRNIDDYACYVVSHEEGQKFIADLMEELHSFDLKLNEKKTAIEKLPIAVTEQWIRQIKTIKTINMTSTTSDNTIMKFPDIRAYLDSVIELMHQNNDKSSILYYAIKVLANQKMTDNAKKYSLKTLLHYAILFPYLVPLVDEFVLKIYNADLYCIDKFANQIYKEGLNFRNHEETYFALFLAIKYNFRIISINIDDLIRTNNCIIFILAFLYFKHMKDSKACKKLKNHALKLSLNDEEFGQNWVFIYEILPKNSLKDDWKDMKKKGITFIKPLSDW